MNIVLSIAGIDVAARQQQVLFFVELYGAVEKFVHLFTAVYIYTNIFLRAFLRNHPPICKSSSVCLALVLSLPFSLLVRGLVILHNFGLHVHEDGSPFGRSAHQIVSFTQLGSASDSFRVRFRVSFGDQFCHLFTFPAAGNVEGPSTVTRFIFNSRAGSSKTS